MLGKAILRITQSKNVMKNQNLTIAMDPCTNTNRWDTHFLGDFLGEFHRNAFNNYRACSRLFDCMSIFKNSFTATRFETFGTTLHPESTHAMNTLRSQSDMSHDWNIYASDRCDGLGHVHATFKFDALSAVFHQHDRGFNALFGTDLIRTKRQITNDEGFGVSACHAANVIGHFIKIHGNGVAGSLNDHSY